MWGGAGYGHRVRWPGCGGGGQYGLVMGTGLVIGSEMAKGGIPTRGVQGHGHGRGQGVVMGAKWPKGV